MIDYTPEQRRTMAEFVASGAHVALRNAAMEQFVDNLRHAENAEDVLHIWQVMQCEEMVHTQLLRAVNRMK